ncbi:Os04g0160801 [Oryza sativa Japonica Group]|uniref:Os04g0160500 protein n=2 Tax=Oryza sativa subsp. japonica TaxID=39947 RepID=A0A0P0W6P4_ORYSJ|nr:Os04g0160500 [Oryza sativa Japonica Group]BAS87840.1 Os04g0160801 [Oryza sativa Japonica Group]|eukprot:NP_001173755.1 Os04g0160500 [Oryza sativa Japonica Group]
MTTKTAFLASFRSSTIALICFFATSWYASAAFINSRPVFLVFANSSSFVLICLSATCWYVSAAFMNSRPAFLVSSRCFTSTADSLVFWCSNSRTLYSSVEDT